jgi:hypothetical protein
MQRCKISELPWADKVEVVALPPKILRKVKGIFTVVRREEPCHEEVLGSGGVLPAFLTSAPGGREWCAARHRASLDADGTFPRLTSASFGPYGLAYPAPRCLTHWVPACTAGARRNLHYFGTPFRRLIYSDTNRRTHIRIWTASIIMAR